MYEIKNIFTLVAYTNLILFKIHKLVFGHEIINHKDKVRHLTKIAYIK